MIDDLFDGPWKILIVAVVVLVFFGSKKLPEAARSLGKSMRILKTEVQGLHDEEQAAGGTADPQAQIAELREQIKTLEQNTRQHSAQAGGLVGATRSGKSALKS